MRMVTKDYDARLLTLFSVYGYLTLVSVKACSVEHLSLVVLVHMREFFTPS